MLFRSIVFTILIIVNFVVITKGSGRIAEVAARFTLDAMPGKQMAIDADLSAGLIDQETAKVRRKALEDVDIGGVRVPAGAKLLVLVASANRDPQVFPDPDRLDIRRANAKEHIAFGYGAHICIGAPLARLELKVVLEEVSARLPGLRMVPGQKLRYLPNTSFRGPRSLLVEWET